MKPLADSDAIADGLKPFTMSHTARTISCTATGRINKIVGSEEGFSPNMMNKAADNENAAPTNPQPDSHRGMSFD